MIEDPCNSCQGQGRVKEQQTLSVKVPAGVDNGDRIRLNGKGEAGQHGAPAGALYVEMRVLPHDIFQRDRNDLHCEVPISFVTAALGGEINVPTLGGEVKLSIPAETQTGKKFRLRGKGVKALRSSQVGDLLCHVLVETPVTLNDDQKELLRNFEQALGEDLHHSPRSKSWFDSVKSFFKT